MNRPFILVQEYIPGFDLSQMREDRAKLVFHPDSVRRNVLHENQTSKVLGHRHPGSGNTDREGPLIQLGKLVATDLLLNNTDRVNLLGQNSGNPANIHVELEIGPMKKGIDKGMLDPYNVKDLQIKSIAAIDNQTYPISIAGARAGSHSYEVFTNYMNAIEAVITEVFVDVRRLRGSYQDGGALKMVPLRDQVPLERMEFPSMRKIVAFLRFATHGASIFDEPTTVGLLTPS